MSEERLFHEALSKSPSERGAFLEAACVGQGQLRRAIEALLAAHDGEGSLLDEPPPGLDLDFEEEGPRPTRKVPSYQYPSTEPDRVIAGRYTLMERIGEGGMGEVWVAKQTEPIKRKVALKLIKAGMDSHAVLQRFEQERQALAMMDHPHIARVLDGGLTPAGRPFFVMELVNGLPLSRFCDQARLTLRQRLELFVPICQAVQHAHQKGVIHRDLKPANILVTLIDGKPVPKIIDFGVAKATSGKLTDETLSTQFGAVVGTLEYMAPEQAGYAGSDVDTRADIYSLGVILYELLTGLRPIDGKRLKQVELTEMVRILREEEPSKPSTRLSTSESLQSMAALRQTEPHKLMALLRGELDWVVMKCLEKQRDRRYETANGLARDIQRYLADEPVEARPPTARYRVGKFLRRNKGFVLATSLIVLTLIVGMVGTTLGMLHAEKKKEEAERAREDEERARDRAWQALDAMTSSVTGDLLSTQKAITPEQKKFLTEVLSYYREFALGTADGERARSRTAEAAYRVGHIEYLLGRKEQAVAAFRQASDGYEELIAEFPAKFDFRYCGARSHNGLGILLADLGYRPEAERQYQQALELQTTLLAEHPNVPHYQQDHANVHNNLGILLFRLGKQTEAEQQYRQALELQKKLSVAYPRNPQFRQDLAKSYHNLGALLKDRGKPDEAKEHYRKALELEKRLVSEMPDMPQYSQNLANSHNDLGALLDRQEERSEAEQHHREALELLKKLSADYPTVPRYRQDLAKTYHHLGRLLKDPGTSVEAENQVRQGLSIQEKLTAESPTVPEYRNDLAAGYTNLGAVFVRSRRRAEAVPQYRKALDLIENLTTDFPDEPKYQSELGGSYGNLGHLAQANERPSESLNWYDKAIHTLNVLLQSHPQFVEAKEHLRKSHLGRAVAYTKLKKFAESIKDWDKVIELSPETEKPRLRSTRATARFQAGQLAEAVAEVAELSELTSWEAGEWYNFACIYADVGSKMPDKKQEYADRAMQMLQQAVKAGWKDIAHMKNDPDLVSLRGREDYKKLMQDLQKKPATGK